MNWRRGLALALVATAGMLNGCALYSETRDKQGQELKAAWSKVDLNAQVATPRKNFAAILEQQQKFEDEIWEFHRTRLADQMLSDWTMGKLQGYIDAEMNAIGGPEAAKAVAAASKTRLARQKLEEGPKREMERTGVPWPGCEGIEGTSADEFTARLKKQGIDPTRMIGVEFAISSGKTKCAELAKAIEEEHALSSSGELATALQALSKDQTQEAADQKQLKEAKKAFDEAVKEYDAAEQALQGDSHSSKEAFNKADKKLRSAAEKLSKLQSAIGQAFVSEERLKSLDEFLTTYENVLAGKGAPEGSNRAAIALALFPDLRDQARAALRDAEKPNLVPLVQQKQLEQAKLAAAQRNLERRRLVLVLREREVDLLKQRSSTLNSARIAAGGVQLPAAAKLGPALVPLKTAPFDVPAGPAQDAALADLKTKSALWRTAALVLHAEGKLQAEVGKTRYQIIGLAYEEPISYAESGLMQWKALIDPSVELLAQFGASGLKAKDIQDFINTLSLLWIAVEVD